jgi:hypothetical protein
MVKAEFLGRCFFMSLSTSVNQTSRKHYGSDPVKVQSMVEHTALEHVFVGRFANQWKTPERRQGPHRDPTHPDRDPTETPHPQTDVGGLSLILGSELSVPISKLCSIVVVIEGDHRSMYLDKLHLLTLSLRIDCPALPRWASISL